jgi:hypothetical protein
MTGPDKFPMTKVLSQVQYTKRWALFHRELVRYCYFLQKKVKHLLLLDFDQNEMIKILRQS